jgi:hypothetical protein
MGTYTNLEGTVNAKHNNTTTEKIPIVVQGNATLAKRQSLTIEDFIPIRVVHQE